MTDYTKLNMERRLFLVGDFNLAGTDRFATHMMISETHTACGLDVWNLKGDYQDCSELGFEISIGINVPGCRNCQRTFKRLFPQEAKKYWNENLYIRLKGK